MCSLLSPTYGWLGPLVPGSPCPYIFTLLDKNAVTLEPSWLIPLLAWPSEDFI